MDLGQKRQIVLRSADGDALVGAAHGVVRKQHGGGQDEGVLAVVLDVGVASIALGMVASEILMGGDIVTDKGGTASEIFIGVGIVTDKRVIASENLIGIDVAIEKGAVASENLVGAGKITSAILIPIDIAIDKDIVAVRHGQGLCLVDGHVLCYFPVSNSDSDAGREGDIPLQLIVVDKTTGWSSDMSIS